MCGETPLEVAHFADERICCFPPVGDFAPQAGNLQHEIGIREPTVPCSGDMIGSRTPVLAWAQRATAVPLTIIPPLVGISTSMRLGRPIASP